MIGTGQLITSNANGDCFRACICSILEIPNRKDLPNITEENGWNDLYQFLGQFGLELSPYTRACWIDGYWIASVPSKNYDDGTTHAIVMHHRKIAWDPSNKKRYHAGHLLSSYTDTMKVYGWHLVVSDASRLHSLDEYRSGSYE